MHLIFHCFNMIVVGSYFVFIMYLMETIFAARDISNDVRQQFFEYILNEQNRYREMNNSNLLQLDQDLCMTTMQIVSKFKLEDILDFLQKSGVNFNYAELSLDSKLNAEEAIKLVSQWYKKKNNDNYSKEPSSSVTADQFTNIICEGPKELGLVLLEKNGVLLVIATYYPPCNEKVENTTNVENPQ